MVLSEKCCRSIIEAELIRRAPEPLLLIGWLSVIVHPADAGIFNPGITGVHYVKYRDISAGFQITSDFPLVPYDITTYISTTFYLRACTKSRIGLQMAAKKVNFVAFVGNISVDIPSSCVLLPIFFAQFRFQSDFSHTL
jgi:hypothetical protein